MTEPRLACPQIGLRRALARRCPPIDIGSIRSERWASVTFTGARHRIECRVAGGRAVELAGRFCSGIGEAEFELRDHIVADIAVAEMTADRDSVSIVLEALTVEAR